MSALRLLAAGLILVFATPRALAQTAPQFVRDHIYGPRGRLILTAEPDTYAPTAPTGLGGGFDSFNCVIDLYWNASTDIGSGVASYTVYRNGSFRGSSSTTSFTDQVIFGAATYTYTVTATDVAGNTSAASSPFTIDKPKCSAAPVGRAITPGVKRDIGFFPLFSPTEALPRRPNILDRLRWLRWSGQLTILQVMLRGPGGGL